MTRRTYGRESGRGLGGVGGGGENITQLAGGSVGEVVGRHEGRYWREGDNKNKMSEYGQERIKEKICFEAS